MTRSKLRNNVFQLKNKKKEKERNKAERIKINMKQMDQGKIVRIWNCNNIDLKMNTAQLQSQKMKMPLKHPLNNDRLKDL